MLFLANQADVFSENFRINFALLENLWVKFVECRKIIYQTTYYQVKSGKLMIPRAEIFCEKSHTEKRFRIF